MYRLEYSIDGIKAVVKSKEPKKLRELIAQIEKSKGVIDWILKNEGGVPLDSFKENHK